MAAIKLDGCPHANHLIFTSICNRRRIHVVDDNLRGRTVYCPIVDDKLGDICTLHVRNRWGVDDRMIRERCGATLWSAYYAPAVGQTVAIHVARRASVQLHCGTRLGR